MRKAVFKRWFPVLAAVLIAVPSRGFALSDTFHEAFDAMTEGATVNGIDSWTVPAGDPEHAVIESGTLKLTGALTTVQTGRSDTYGSLSPTWIEYVVKPGVGTEEREIPTTGIAAVTFGMSGDIFASDGTTWIKTGKQFTADTWYRVQMKLDFSTHTYDIYCSPAATPKTPFTPDKENLHFIDNTVSSMSRFGFYGAYNGSSQADSRVNEVVVHTIDRLQITTSPQTLVRGAASGAITVQLQNANSEPQTAWMDLTLELRASTTTAEFSLSQENWVPITSITLPQGSQQLNFYFKDFKEGRPTVTVNEYPDRGWTDAEQEEKIVSEGEYFGITTTTPQVAGKPFLVQITAKDSEGNTDTSYNGTVEIFAGYVNPLTGTKILLPDAVTLAEGFAEVNMSYPDAGTIKITVRDINESSKLGYSGDITFFPDSFSVSADATQVVGKNFPLTVRALSKNGDVAPNYEGPAVLGAVPVNPPEVSGGVLNPSEVTTQFQSGVATLDSAYNRWGEVAIQASDKDHPEQKGQSAPISFVPKSLSLAVKPPSATRNFFYAAENMEITLSVLGDDGLPIENFQGSVSITSTPSLNIPASYTFLPVDKGKKTFVIPAGTPGFYKLKMEDIAENLSVESEKIEVKDATIQVISTAAPVGTTVVEIHLVDSKGKRITSENEMRVTIIITEEVLNGSTFFSNAGQPIIFKNGVARLIIGDTEAETVEISAKSPYGLKVLNGKVTFGRVGASGVGALMLRETKD